MDVNLQAEIVRRTDAMERRSKQPPVEALEDLLTEAAAVLLSLSAEMRKADRRLAELDRRDEIERKKLAQRSREAGEAQNEMTALLRRIRRLYEVALSETYTQG